MQLHAQVSRRKAGPEFEIAGRALRPWHGGARNQRTTEGGTQTTDEAHSLRTFVFAATRLQLSWSLASKLRSRSLS
jgi:hypothetical protein